MTFGYVIGRAACGRTHLAVLDWGGGLGNYYVFARELFPEVAFDYVVKDLPIFCEAGEKLLPDVEFVSDDSAALARQYDLVFASSSAQYSFDFYDVIRGLARSATRWLMVTRLPCISRHDDFVVVQRPHRHGYMTEYPCWFVNRGRFLAAVESYGFALEREFLQAPESLVGNAPEQGRYTGFLFRRKSND
jgi:putative methyltransferase (TIGR04325 family)